MKNTTRSTSDAALETAARLADWLHHRYLPDKAIDVLDEAGFRPG